MRELDMAVLSIPNERWTDKREKKGLARNGLVQNPNKYSHGQLFSPDLTCPALPCINLFWYADKK